MKLEAQIAPRRLTAEQQVLIGQKCQGLTGKLIIVKSYALDPEGIALGFQIANALHNEGLTVLQNLASATPSGGLQTGISIEGHDDMEPFASCLAGALYSIGHLAVALNGAPVGSSDTTPLGHPGMGINVVTSLENQPHILVMVGSKPIVLANREPPLKGSP